jgi:predicted phosphodiesterase
MQEVNLKSNSLWLMGDTHDLEALKGTARAIPENTTIVHVGDLGVGGLQLSKSDVRRHLRDVNESMRRKNQTLIAIRGNHDDPSFFPHSLSNMSLLGDYSVGIFPNKKRVLFVGGSVSIDRVWRKAIRASWWEGEITAPPEEAEIENCDVVIAHDCPSFVNSSTESLKTNRTGFVKNDSSLIEDCDTQRKKMDKILKLASPSCWIYGHYHNADRKFHKNCGFSCMDICDISEFKWEGKGASMQFAEQGGRWASAQPLDGLSV